MSGFMIVKGATAWWPVKWAEPVDGGGTAECKIEMKFRRLSLEEHQMPVSSDEAFIKLVASDWRQITDEAGRPAPFNDANINEMILRPAFVTALAEAFSAFTRALPEAPQDKQYPAPEGLPAAGAVTADQSVKAARGPRRKQLPNASPLMPRC